MKLFYFTRRVDFLVEFLMNNSAGKTFLSGHKPAGGEIDGPNSSQSLVV
jgi:hypothetical protein